MGTTHRSADVLERARLTLAAAGLVGTPLLLMTYFVLNPSYGDVHSADIARSIAAHPTRCTAADIAAFIGVLLAVPAILAFLRLLRPRTPWLASIGCSAAIVGKVALFGALVLDVVAIELDGDVAAYHDIVTNPVLEVVNGVIALHIVGSVLIGIALYRTRLVPRALAAAATAAPVVHLAAYFMDQVWIDVICWLVAAATGWVFAVALYREAGDRRPAPTSVLADG